MSGIQNQLAEEISALQSVLFDEGLANWTELQHIQSSYNTVINACDSDRKALEVQAKFIFDPSLSIKDATRQTEDLLAAWNYGDAPSCSALIAFTRDRLNLNISPDLSHSLALAALLSDVKNTVPYHNNLHFKKVVFQAIRLIVSHNDLFGGSKKALSDADIALLLLAACIHDLGHDGTGNMLRGVFKQSRLEQQSLDILIPYLEKTGLTPDSDEVSALNVMILSTDVTPINDLGNPMNQMKAAYRFHYLGDNQKVDSLHLDGNMKPLQKNEKLSLMSLLLHEADIATSAGVSYQITQHETILYREEVCEDGACPQHVVDFLNNICQRQFLSEAGQRLFGANMARILAQAEDNAQDGNEEYCGKALKENLLQSANSPEKSIN